MSRTPIAAFPLAWPPGRARTAAPQDSQFKVTLSGAVTHIKREVWALGGTELVVSTNQPLTRDGGPTVTRSPSKDTGAAVYFTLRKKPMCFACDRWVAVEDNLRAIAKTVEALRGIERWGSGQMVEQAFTGFTALPSPPQWWQILKVKSTASMAEIESAFRILAFDNHPDRGGDSDHMARINRARDQGLEQFSK